MTMPGTPSASTVPASRIALAALLLGALAIGFSGIFVRLSELGPTATAFYRVALTIPVFVIWSGLERSSGASAPARPTVARDYWGLVGAGLFFAGDLAFWHWSLMLTTVANSTLFANFTPIIVTLVAWLFFGERVTRVFLGGMALALAGAVALMSTSLELGPDNIAGDALGLVTAVFYSAYLLTVARLRIRFSTATIMAWTGAVSAAVLLPTTLLVGEGLVAATAAGWAVLAAIALVSQAGGQGLIAYALAHLPASFSSVSLLVQPLAAAIFAWIILGEALGWMQGLGGALVLAGIVFARRGSRGG